MALGSRLNALPRRGRPSPLEASGWLAPLWIPTWTCCVLAVTACTDPPRPGPITLPGPPTSGAPAPGFGWAGTITVNPSGGIDEALDALRLNASLFVCGADSTLGGTDLQWRVQKWNASSGTPDSGFGVGGVLAANPSTGIDRLAAMASDGTHLYLVGFDSSAGDRGWRIEKRQATDGQLDAGFGASGAVTANPSGGPDEATGLVLDGSSLYVIGVDEVAGAGDWRWRIEKRQLSDGALVSGFGSGGVVTSNPSSGVDRPAAVTWDGTSLYVAGFDSNPGNRQWRVEKRGGSDGALDATFGTSGVLTFNPSTGLDEATALVLDGTAVLVGGFDEAPGIGDTQWRLERRAAGDGALISGFGASGTLTSNPSSGADEVRDVHRLSASILVVVGSDATPNPGAGDRRWRIEKRALSSGSLSAPFGTAGVVTSDPGTFDDVPSAVVSTGSTIIVVGSDFAPTDPRWRIQAWYR